LRLPECRAETPGIEELTEREMLEAILGSVQYAHVKLDHIRTYWKRMVKRKKTRLTAEFLRKDAELRAEIDRMLEILRREREERASSTQGPFRT